MQAQTPEVSAEKATTPVITSAVQLGASYMANVEAKKSQGGQQ